MSEGNSENPNLVKLEDFDGELEEQWQDIHGHKVLDKNGDEVGTVEDL
jgi:ribosomal 30S subunit maturation factor RimM